MSEQAPPAGLCEFQVDVYEKDGSWGMTWVQLVDVDADGTFRNVSWDEDLERWVPGDTEDFSRDYGRGVMKTQGEPVAWKRHDDLEDEHGEYGYQEGLSVSWAPSFAKAVSDLYEHVISGRQKTDNTVI